MLLDRFKEAKMPEIEALHDLAKKGKLPIPTHTPMPGGRPDFLNALKHPAGGKDLAVIAEFKQASPSRGVIIDGLRPEDVSEQYAQAGASCISVLTEHQFFGGELGYLQRMSKPGVPLLRKDFIFDELQVLATASTPASALLLIVRLTPDAELLRRLREQAERFGIHAVVEIFDEADLHLARESGARIIQVNARDLDTLKTDRNICLELARHKNHGEIWIAASAMDKAEHLRSAKQSGYDAVLMGTALMEHGTPGETLASILSSYES